MKKFIATNWYRFITATTMLIFACTLFVFCLKNNIVKAGVSNTVPDSTPANAWMVVKGNTVYEVTWTPVGGYKCKPVCNSIQ